MFDTTEMSSLLPKKLFEPPPERTHPLQEITIHKNFLQTTRLIPQYKLDPTQIPKFSQKKSQKRKKSLMVPAQL